MHCVDLTPSKIHISYLDTFNSTEKIIMPLRIVPVDGDFLWTGQRKVPAEQPAFYKHIRSAIIMDIPVLTCTEGWRWPVWFFLSYLLRLQQGYSAQWPWAERNSRSNRCALLLNVKKDEEIINYKSEFWDWKSRKSISNSGLLKWK